MSTTNEDIAATVVELLGHLTTPNEPETNIVSVSGTAVVSGDFASEGDDNESL